MNWLYKDPVTVGALEVADVLNATVVFTLLLVQPNPAPNAIFELCRAEESQDAVASIGNCDSLANVRCVDRHGSAPNGST
eukprot:m.205678 g.205678  ORF g.205678 m.205678 type:complete len:80 (-) comp17097_c0_seq2:43-282(-)